jgi:hypothetical protein
MHRLNMTPPPVRLKVALVLLAFGAVATIVSGQWWLYLFYAYMAASIFILTPWRARRDYRLNPAIAEPMSITFTEEGLLRKNEAREVAVTDKRGKLLVREPALIPWSRFKKWKVNRHMLLLYLDWRTMVPIPKAWFASPQAFDEFHARIKDKVRQAR